MYVDTLSMQLYGDLPDSLRYKDIGETLFTGRPIHFMMYLVVFLTWLVMFRTAWGLRVRSAGENPHAAETLGIDVVKLRYQSVLLGGLVLLVIMMVTAGYIVYFKFIYAGTDPQGLITWQLRDVNNDGIVSYADRRDLNYYIYNANLRANWLNGPARYRADAEINPFTYLEWEPQAAAPWFTPEGCYMDTDGNGVINNLDYLAMKLNWTKVTPWYGGAPKASAAAASFTMDQNYPNPFNPSTMISYTAPEASHVRLVVTDALGREVAELENGSVDAGVHEVQFDGSQLASGTYIATITMTGVESGMTFTKTIKMALSK